MLPEVPGETPEHHLGGTRLGVRNDLSLPIAAAAVSLSIGAYLELLSSAKKLISLLQPRTNEAEGENSPVI